MHSTGFPTVTNILPSRSQTKETEQIIQTSSCLLLYHSLFSISILGQSKCMWKKKHTEQKLRSQPLECTNYTFYVFVVKFVEFNLIQCRSKSNAAQSSSSSHVNNNSFFLLLFLFHVCKKKLNNISTFWLNDLVRGPINILFVGIPKTEDTEWNVNSWSRHTKYTFSYITNTKLK